MSSISWHSLRKVYSHSKKSGTWKSHALEVARFLITVACSVLLTVWVQATNVEDSKGKKSKSKAAVSHAPTESWNEELNDFYSSYLSEVLRTLRADRSLRLAQLEIPGTALSYQRNIATTETGGESFRLQARTKAIPVIAVSKSAKPFLEEMRITYIDPQSLPMKLVKATPALNQNVWKQFLLIPDVTGSHAKRFQFGK